MKDYKILLVLGKAIGDSLCFTPVVRALKQSNPHLMLDLLSVNPQISEMYSFNPDINKVCALPTKKEMKKMASYYDFAIAFPMDVDSLYYLNRIGLKTFYPGYFSKPHSESALDLVLFLFPETKAFKITQYYVYPQPQHEKAVDDILNQHKDKLPDDAILIGCHLGYSGLAANKKSWFDRVIKKKYGVKVWPLFNYAELLKRLLKYNDRIRMIIVGTAAEKKLVKKFFKPYSKVVIDLCDQTNLLTLSALMKRFHCYIGGDSGPLHFASAANIPMLALMFSKIAQASQPYPPADYKQVIVKEKMTDITVDEVFERLKDILEGNIKLV